MERRVTDRILAARGLRAFADGYVSLLLPLYLLQIGYSTLQIGVLATATLEASAALAGREHGHLATQDFAVAFLIAGALAASAAPFFARLAPDAGAGVSGHRMPARRGV